MRRAAGERPLRSSSRFDERYFIAVYQPVAVSDRTELNWTSRVGSLPSACRDDHHAEEGRGGGGTITATRTGSTSDQTNTQTSVQSTDDGSDKRGNINKNR